MINQKQLSLLYFGKRLDTGGEGIIIGNNPVGHYFLLVFNSNELFHLIHDLETENVHHRQKFW